MSSLTEDLKVVMFKIEQKDPYGAIDAYDFMKAHAAELQGLARKAERYDFLRDPDKAAEVGVYGCVGAAWLDQTIDDAISLERDAALSAAKERGDG